MIVQVYFDGESLQARYNPEKWPVPKSGVYTVLVAVCSLDVEGTVVCCPRASFQLVSANPRFWADRWLRTVSQSIWLPAWALVRVHAGTARQAWEFHPVGMILLLVVVLDPHATWICGCWYAVARSDCYQLAGPAAPAGVHTHDGRVSTH